MTRNFVKQYGAERTGTNVLRLLLKQRFMNIEVLMHTLGDKHSPPVDYVALREALEQPCDPYEEISWATLNNPSSTTDLTDQEQTDYLRTISPELARAILENRFFCLISIKQPYAWIYSYLKNQRLLSVQWVARNYLDLAKICKGFNRRYAAWHALLDEFPEHTQFIRFEDLINDAEKLALSIKTKFQFQEFGGSTFHCREVVNPSHWDNTEASIATESFDRDFYASHSYFKFLTPPIIEVVHHSIDWALMERFGYHDSISR